MNQDLRNPFLNDVFVPGSDRLPGVARIHHSAFERVVASVESLVSPTEENSPADFLGRLILVKAPRAGYGKSHFSARIEKRLAPLATTFSLPFDPSRPISWPVVFSSALRQLGHASPTKSGATSLLDETSRFLFAQLTLAHRQEGSSLLDDCPVDDTQLRSQFAQVLSPDHPSGAFGWMDKRGRELCYQASPGFQEAIGLRGSELGFWTRLLMDQQLRGEAGLESLRGLSSGEARERLLQLLRIHSFYRPVLLVADGLDGFFQSDSAGLEIANLLTGIRQSIPRSVTLLSLNEDIWESVFEQRLPSALLDRLDGETETLRAIAPKAASELIRSRLESTPLSFTGIDRFLDRLEHEHLWMDAETKLYPRGVLRQAKELWDLHAKDFLQPSEEDADTDSPISLAGLTDKAEFFEALRDEKPLPATPPRPPAQSPPLPSSSQERGVENPFFAPPGMPPREKLAGIDSIIADIRGTGKRVVSEPSAPSSPSETPPETLEAGDLKVRTISEPFPTAPVAPQILEDLDEEKPSARVSKAELERELKETQKSVLESAPLELQLPRIGELLRIVGANHRGLHQTEERFPSSQTTCLRWAVRGLSVLIGFESPKNVYFWNHLLQHSLAASPPEKISAFSHHSQSFDPGLFASFGFSPSVIGRHIDIIEMNDKELSMLYAADEVRKKYENRPENDQATELITLFLDPLWRRISRPV